MEILNPRIWEKTKVFKDLVSDLTQNWTIDPLTPEQRRRIRYCSAWPKPGEEIPHMESGKFGHSMSEYKKRRYGGQPGNYGQGWNIVWGVKDSSMAYYTLSPEEIDELILDSIELIMATEN